MYSIKINFDFSLFIYDEIKMIAAFKTDLRGEPAKNVPIKINLI